MEQQWNDNNFGNEVEFQNAPQENNKDTKDGLCITSLVLGIVGFLVNPLYIVSVLAIIFGAVGMNANGPQANKAKVGLILGIIAVCLQVIVDFILTILTAGAGGVSFCC